MGRMRTCDSVGASRARPEPAVDDGQSAAAHLGGAVALLGDAAGALAAHGPAAEQERGDEEDHER